MCLAFIALDAHPRHPLIVVTNRDEEYARPREPAQHWPERPGLFAGRDLRRGGSWCGVNTRGEVALITFVREARTEKRPIRSCGEMIVDFLSEGRSPLLFLAELMRREQEYHGFNLVLGSPDAIYHYSNRGQGITKLTPGVHGVSNALLNTPWPKVEWGKQRLAELLRDEELHPDAAFAMMANKTRAKLNDLPTTGRSAETELLLSSLFVTAPEFGEGTLATTLIRYDVDGKLHFWERSFAEQGVITGEITTSIALVGSK